VNIQTKEDLLLILNHEVPEVMAEIQHEKKLNNSTRSDICKVIIRGLLKSNTNKT
jgi:hypothetical protein